MALLSKLTTALHVFVQIIYETKRRPLHPSTPLEIDVSFLTQNNTKHFTPQHASASFCPRQSPLLLNLPTDHRNLLHMTLEHRVGLPIFLIPNRCQFFLYVPSTEQEKNVMHLITCWDAHHNHNKTWRLKGRGLNSGERNTPKRKRAQSKMKWQATTSPESLMAPRRKHAPRSHVEFLCKRVTAKVIRAVGDSGNWRNLLEGKWWQYLWRIAHAITDEILSPGVEPGISVYRRLGLPRMRDIRSDILHPQPSVLNQASVHGNSGFDLRRLKCPDFINNRAARAGNEQTVSANGGVYIFGMVRILYQYFPLFFEMLARSRFRKQLLGFSSLAVSKKQLPRCEFLSWF